MPKIIGTELDKNGENVTILHSGFLSESPIVPHYMREFSSLIDQGLAAPVINATNVSKVIYATIDNDIAGFIVFEFKDDSSRTLKILLGTVLEKYRRRGVYQILHRYLEIVAKHHKSSKIQSFVHIDNTKMIDLSKKLNKSPVFYLMEKQI